jgi:hypothetical protein
MDPKQEAEVWECLVAGRPLDGLGLPIVAGRIDLRGLSAPRPKVVGEREQGALRVTQLGNLVRIRAAHWSGIDFSNAHLASLRFFDSIIENCSFGAAECSDWRMWGTTVRDTEFRGTNLRESALGGIENGKRNSFIRVSFDEADLRGTTYTSCDMLKSKFLRCNLAKVDFNGAVFSDCVFEGQLDAVIFHDRAFRGEAYPANEMANVDFRKASFRHVEFRGLDVDTVRWPEDDNHVLIQDYKATLERGLALIKDRTDVEARGLRRALEIRLKWAGPRQEQGVLNKLDLVRAAGPELASEFLRAVVRH